MRLTHATSLPLLAFLGPLAAQAHFPPPPTPANNPTTVTKALLGKALFWDEQLSSSRSVACGTCHSPAAGGSDPRTALPTHPGADGVRGTADDVRGSHGIPRQNAAGDYLGDPVVGAHAQISTRRAASVINAAYQPLLFRDGSSDGRFVDPTSGAVLAVDAALEAQALHSPVDDTQMAHVGRTWDEIAVDLADLKPLALADQLPADLDLFVWCQTYNTLFTTVFGTRGVTPARIAEALAAYQRTLISDQSRYDQFLAGTGALTAQEQAGLAVFNQHCATCHTDLASHSQPVPLQFRRTGVRPSTQDPGRFAVTADPNDLGKFMVPGLRNIALRAPYMHDGSKATLDDVVAFYDRGGDFGPVDPDVAAIASQLTATQRADLLAFLDTLTDPRVAQQQAPFDRPRLWSESPRAPIVFGNATAGAGSSAPVMVAETPAWLSTRKLTYAIDGMPAGRLHFFVFDIGKSPTPFDVFGHETWFAQLLPQFYFLFALQNAGSGRGFSSVRFHVPFNPTLIPTTLVAQWFVEDPLSPAGLASSRSVRLPLFR